MLRWDAVAHGGKTGTTTKPSEETPLDLVSPTMFKNTIYHERLACCFVLSELLSAAVITSPVWVPVLGNQLLCKHSKLAFFP